MPAKRKEEAVSYRVISQSQIDSRYARGVKHTNGLVERWVNGALNNEAAIKEALSVEGNDEKLLQVANAIDLLVPDSQEPITYFKIRKSMIADRLKDKAVIYNTDFAKLVQLSRNALYKRVYDL